MRQDSRRADPRQPRGDGDDVSVVTKILLGTIAVVVCDGELLLAFALCGDRHSTYGTIVAFSNLPPRM